jgi:uncharacterized membrane protein SirB2
MYETVLAFHFIGLAFGVGGGVVMLIMGASAARLPADEGRRLLERLRPVTLLIAVGILLLILSGFAMMPRWTTSFTGMREVWFITKMVFVAIIVISVGMMHMRMAQARRTGTAPPAGQMKAFSVIANLSGLAAIAIAVSIFG